MARSTSLFLNRVEEGSASGSLMENGNVYICPGSSLRPQKSLSSKLSMQNTRSDSLKKNKGKKKF
jgi:hypothetical protein